MPRKSVWLFVVVNIVFIVFLVHSVWTLLSLLVVDGSNDMISRAELPGPNSEVPKSKEMIIPKIIHQTYVNESIPFHWKEAQQSCLDLHEDYEYKLWTDKLSREFIAAEYPWFLETFDNYQFPIQRADAIRYFVLAHFGGIYIDLDDGCQRRLDPLLTYSAWVRRTVPTGISNDVMGSVPHHPFFLKVIDSLPRYDRSWFLPYITVMSSTGPLFLSVIWRHYNSAGKLEDKNRLRVLFPDEYSKHSWSFFTHHQGSSWHQNDVRLIMWMSHHWMLVTVFGFAIGFLVFGTLWFLYGRLLSNSPKGQSLRRRFPFWRKVAKVAHIGVKKNDYELVVRDIEDRIE